MHKKNGAQCETCTSYDPVSLRILIIKLDSMGDVLRTTSVLPALREEHPACFITWITRREAVELIVHNPLLDELLVLESGALSQLLVRKFDLVLGLDMSRDSGALCALARAADKRGFSIDAAGALFPLNESAKEWFYLGLNDRLKKENCKSYQQILLELCGLPAARLHPPQYYITEEENRCGRDLVVNLGLDPSRPVIGVNTGSGSRWKMKSLPFDGLKSLIEKLAATFRCCCSAARKRWIKTPGCPVSPAFLTAAAATACGSLPALSTSAAWLLPVTRWPCIWRWLSASSCLPYSVPRQPMR